MWASACSSSLDRRETRAFYFIVCVLLAVSASSGSTTTQELRGRKQRKQRRRRTKIQRKSSKNRSKIDEKSTKNRRKIALGQFWAFKAVSGTRRDALGTALGRPKVAPRPILGRPGRAKSGQEPSKSVPGTVPRHCRTAPERCPSAFGASSSVERARGTIFRRFFVVAQKLRCAKNVAPAIVLYTSHEVSTERAGATKKLEN